MLNIAEKFQERDHDSWVTLAGEAPLHRPLPTLLPSREPSATTSLAPATLRFARTARALALLFRASPLEPLHGVRANLAHEPNVTKSGATKHPPAAAPAMIDYDGVKDLGGSDSERRVARRSRL